MSELSKFEGGGESLNIPLLVRFNLQLTHAASNQEAQVAFKKYLVAENIPIFENDDDIDHFIGVLCTEQTLPDSQQFRIDDRVAKDKYRIALYKDVIPLCEYSRDTNTLDEWLPQVMQVVLPEHSDYSVRACVKTLAVSCADLDHDVCPLRLVARDIESAVHDPMFMSSQYILDEQKACTDVLRRLEYLASREIFPPAYVAQLRSSYIEMFHNVFGGDES